MSKVVCGMEFMEEDLVRFEGFTAVTMRNAVFWVVMLCGSCKNQCFGGTYRPIIRVTGIGDIGTTLAVTRN
jgi:hypothetical protein